MESRLPSSLYSAEESRLLDQIAIQKFGIPGYTLMSRAGQAVFDLLQTEFTLAKRILVCCGAGNNAGDGYVVARLAQKAGYDVTLVSLIEPDKLKGDAQKAYQEWKSLGYLPVEFEAELLDTTDVVIDALLGTGLERDVEGEWKELINQVNAAAVPVIAVDIPSGLNADTGNVMGVSIKAEYTVSFIGLKKGLFTHQAREYCGQIIFYDLQVPATVYEQVGASAQLLDWQDLQSWLQPRSAVSHKGHHGHVLIVGGNYSMAGAARMAGEAALRAGAGLVSVVTRPEHVSSMVSARPELMVHGSENGVIPKSLLSKVNAIAIGPGLGTDDWARRLLSCVLASKQPKVVDADALNLLSDEAIQRDDWVLTPHPGEAARLLEEEASTIQQSRFTAVDMLQQKYGGSVVLKGAGSLVKSAEGLIGVCPYGNPGMASAGMGDVLTGVIAALIAQGYSPDRAAPLGVVIHALAGDQVAAEGEKGLIASDLFDSIRRFVNARS